MTKRLVKLALQQKRLSPEAAEALRGGKELTPETEQIIAVLRRDLADLASIRALSPESETLADCIRTSSLFSKGGLTLTEELQSLVTDIGKLSDIELLRLGFKNSEIAMLREINAASAQGMRLSAIGAALQKTAPKNWRTLLKASIEEGRKAVPGYVAIGGGFALWQIYRIATDPSIPDEEQTRHIGDVIYQTFPWQF
jgi:hypothetical protein